LVNETVALGITAPEGSVTVPVMSPVMRVCAASRGVSLRRQTKKRDLLVLNMVTLLRHDSAPTIRATYARQADGVLRFLILKDPDSPDACR
jgi:hypothetical protein